VSIPYCFNTTADKIALSDIVVEVWKTWSVKIGKPGPDHRIWGFVETPDTCLDSAGNWRPELLHQTLRVQVDYDASSATVGYISENDDNRAGRHSLRLHLSSPTFTTKLVTVAHQIGHVLGLVHEHQRTDRKDPPPPLQPTLQLIFPGDQWVNFDCSELAGYAQAKAQYDQRPAWYPVRDFNQICNSNWMDRAWFGWTYPPEYSWDMGPNIQHRSWDYDHNSVMTFPSYAQNPNSGVGEVPLVQWKQGGINRPPFNTAPTNDNAYLIEQVWDISDSDFEAIKALYPWP
jgi:hypothetical protein